MSRLPSSVPLLGAMAAFGLIDGIAYWFLSYEVAGSVLLVGFGGASAVGAIIAKRKASRQPRSAKPSSDAASEDRPGPGPVPGPGWAPLGLAAGLTTTAGGLTFGPWLIIAGLLLTVLSAHHWLITAMAEAASARHEADGPDGEAGPGG